MKIMEKAKITGQKAIEKIFLWIFPVGFLIFSGESVLATRSVLPQHLSAKSQVPNPKTCPADVESLMPSLLRDLPGYANRVIQRSRLRNIKSESTYIILAGRPEFEPLPLGPGRTEPTISPNTGKPTEQPSDDPRQVFITTLERNYATGQTVQLQHYHWLFLTKTDSGWRVAMMFSRLGIYPAGKPPLPPRDSSDGVIAQAIDLWLRDCDEGAIRF